MKNRIWGWCIAVLLVLAGFVPGWGKTLGVIYTYQPVEIDGKTGDWENIARYKSYGGNVEYAFKMDKSNLYILFVFNDPDLLSTFSSGGMKIFINPSSSRKRELGIHFIKRTLTAGQMVELLEKRYGPLPEDRRREVYSRPQYHIYQSVIIKEDRQETTSIQLNARESCAFIVAEESDGRVIAEYKIPHPVQREILKAEQLPDEIRLVFEWGGMTSEMYQQQMKMRQARSHSGNTQEDRISSITEDRDGVDQPYLSAGARNLGPQKYTINLKLGLPVEKLKES